MNTPCSRCILEDLRVCRLPSGRHWIGTCRECGEPRFLNHDGDPVDVLDGIRADEIERKAVA